MRKEYALVCVYLLVFCILSSVGSPSPWVGVFGVCALFGCIVLGAFWLPAGDDLALQGSPQNVWLGVHRTAASLGLGLTLAFVVWALSAYIFKTLFWGHVCLAFIFPFAVVRFWRQRAVYSSFFAVKGIHLFLLVTWGAAFYIYGVNEIQYDASRYIYTYVYDAYFHLKMGRWIGVFGLPVPEITGALGAQDTVSYYFGVPLLNEGLRQLGHVTPYQAMRVLSFILFTLLALSSLSLVRSFRIGKAARFIAAWSPLAFAGVGIFVPYRTYGLKIWSNPVFHNGGELSWLTSGAMYHNLTLLGGVAFLFVAFVLFEQFFRKSSASIFVLGCLLAWMSAQCKMTNAIVFFPAFFLALLFLRQRWYTWIQTLLTAGLCVLVFYLPHLMGYEVLSGSSWKYKWKYLLDLKKYAGLFNLAGVLLVFAVIHWFVFLYRVVKKKRPRWGDIVAIMLLGGALFFILFYEPARLAHGNQHWSYIASLILYTPWVFATVFAWFYRATEATSERPKNKQFRKRASQVLALCFLAWLWLQLGIGGLYAFRYPLMSARFAQLREVRVLEWMNDVVPKTSRVLIDPSLSSRYILAPYSTLRTFFPGGSGDPFGAKELRMWRSMFRYGAERKKEIQAFLKTRDAFLVGGQTARYIPLLKSWKWKRIDPPQKNKKAQKLYSLWVNPNRTR